MRIVALATCHDRRPSTLRALEALERQTLPDDTRLEVHIVDDGSSDGTAEAVAARFPDVRIHEGSGDLFWAGGMRFGWARCGAAAPPDALLVFNDDVLLEDDAVATLLETARTVEGQGCGCFAVTGSFRSSDCGSVAYGGVVRASSWHPLRFRRLAPAGHPVDCDTLNMNFALISREALETIGFLSSDYVHCRADFDFGLRLRRAGGRVVLADRYVGVCDRNRIEGTSREPGISFAQRWRRLTSIKEHDPRERAHYFRAHGGPLWPIFWALPYLRAIGEQLLPRRRGARRH